MLKPDVEMVHSESGHVYYGGKIYDLTRMADGWTLTRPTQPEKLCIAPSVDDVCAWLQVQATV